MDPLAPFRTLEFGLATLADAAARLSGHLASPEDERVRDAADERTIRYYQTTGLLDRPLRYDGRTAVYGYRHLLQVVSVKALQASGLSLAQVQRALAGATTPQLESAVSDAMGLRTEPHRSAPLVECDAPVATHPVGEGPFQSRPDVATVPTLRAYIVSTGVTLTIDPAVVADSDALAQHIAQFLTTLPPNFRSQP